MITEISEAALKMIQDEAWEFFQNAAGVGTDKRDHLADTVEHAFQHALEEGIVVLPVKSTEIDNALNDLQNLILQLQAEGDMVRANQLLSIGRIQRQR